MEEVNTMVMIIWDGIQEWILCKLLLTFSLKQLSKRIKSRVEAVNFYKSNIHNGEIQIMNAPEDFKENGYCNVSLIENKKNKKRLETYW